MKKSKQKNNGITLIALVVTVIVLLILAGVTIATLTGENGIITKAIEARDETERASIIEQAKIDILEIQTENQSGNITQEQLKNVLDKYFDGVPDDYTIDDMLEVMSKPCVYCGDTSRIGLDRIDNSKGHTKDNTVPCCYECNCARNNNFTYDEMLQIGKVIRDIKLKRKNNK